MSISVLKVSPEIEILVPPKPVRAIGIDLGTTNSAIAEVFVAPDMENPAKARCLDVDQWTRQGPQIDSLVPSVLAIHDNQVRVGAGAKDLRSRLADHKLERNRSIFWDCKNDIGVRRTYSGAPAGFRSAKEIGGHVLKFLISAASDADSPAAAATVVTVPASFQAAQRQDTIDAARLACVELTAGALMDEPIAAFVAFAMSHGAQVFSTISETRRLVVFDFGGGTCDIAVFELRSPTDRAPGSIGVAPLAVSRYHRLGGGDIDRKIAVDVLIPQFLEQNGLQAYDLDFHDKSNTVIPSLLGCAESLKVGLCKEISRQKRLDRYEEVRSTLVQKNPSVYPCHVLNGEQLSLHTPTLSAIEFDNVLQPFMDQDLLHARETDYLMTCSIFAPIRDALTRARLDRREIDFCLMVGGSSLIPQIVDSVQEFFTTAKLLSFNDWDDTQTAVAHGASWQALSIALHGKSLIRPITSSSICIRTSNGPIELIPNGVELPFPPSKEMGRSDRLVVPEIDLFADMKLRVELCDANDRLIMSELWTPAIGVEQGDPLQISYRMDENQILHFRLALGGKNDEVEPLDLIIENPLSNVVNPNAKRDEILALEEKMRLEEMTDSEERRVVEKIADLEADLGRFERSLHLLGELNGATPSGSLLNKMGIIAGQMGDHEREERFFREAARLSPTWTGPLFNLSLAQERQGNLEKANQIIDDAITRDANPPALIMKANLVGKLKQSKKQRESLLERAFSAFSPLSTLSDFQLSWYLFGAQLAGDGARKKAAVAERKRRGDSPIRTREGVLPWTKGEIARR